MDEVLALEIGHGQLRAAVVNGDGLLTPVLRTSTEHEDHDPVHAARRAAMRLGVPRDMWAIAAVHHGSTARVRATSVSAHTVNGLQVRRLGDALGRPTLAGDAGEVAAAGEARFGAGSIAKTMALIRVSAEPTYSLITYGQIVRTLGLLPPRGRGPSTWDDDPIALVHRGAQLALAVAETYEPDAIVLTSSDLAITALTIERVQRIRERRGTSLAPFALRSSQLGEDATLLGCAIWPTASGRFGTPSDIVRTG